MRTAITYGNREYLFLWSYAIQCKQFWPEFLHDCTYSPRENAWYHKKHGKLEVTRSAEASVGVLKAHGISDDHIRTILGENNGAT